MIQVYQPSLTCRHSRIFYSKETVTHIYPPTTSASMAVSYGANRPSAALSSPLYQTAAATVAAFAYS